MRADSNWFTPSPLGYILHNIHSFSFIVYRKACHFPSHQMAFSSHCWQHQRGDSCGPGHSSSMHISFQKDCWLVIHFPFLWIHLKSDNYLHELWYAIKAENLIHTKWHKHLLSLTNKTRIQSEPTPTSRSDRWYMIWEIVLCF